MFQRTLNSLTGRVILLTFAGSLISIIAMAIAILWIFEKSLETQLDNHLTAYTDITAAVIKYKDGTISVDDKNALLKSIPRHWQIETTERRLSKSDLLANWIPLPDKVPLQPVRFNFTTKHGTIIRAVRQAFEYPNKEKLIITFGLDHEITNAYKNELRSQYQRHVMIALSVLIIIFLSIGALIITLITRPLNKVTRSLYAVQSGKAARIEGEYPHEIASLTDQLNRLIDYTASIIDRHRTFSSNLAHALRTPLTSIRNEAHSDAIRDRVDDMLRLIERNLARVHAAGDINILAPSISAEPILRRICESFGKLHNKNIEQTYATDLVLNCDEADLYEILGNIIENACKFSHSKIRVQISNNKITIEDDGPGIPEGTLDNAMLRGTTLDKSKPGSGIGLSITKDLLALYKGELQLSRSSLGGLKATIIFHIP